MNNFKNRVSHDYLDVQERNITMFFEQKKKKYCETELENEGIKYKGQ